MTDKTPATGPDWPEALTAAAAAYRAEEKARYRSDGFEDRMRARLAADEALNRSVGGFWRDVDPDPVPA